MKKNSKETNKPAEPAEESVLVHLPPFSGDFSMFVTLRNKKEKVPVANEKIWREPPV